MRTIIYSALITALLACNNNKEEKVTADTIATMQHHTVETKHDFSGISFASAKDTTCHMPLTAGISDTAVVDGKVYGFCSTECKEEFIKTLHAKAAH